MSIPQQTPSVVDRLSRQRIGPLMVLNIMENVEASDYSATINLIATKKHERMLNPNSPQAKAVTGLEHQILCFERAIRIISYHAIIFYNCMCQTDVS